MFFNARSLLYSDVISLPATKSAGALTYSSDVLSLPTLYKAELVIMAADLSKVTDTVSILAKGSWDGGTTWVTLGTYTDVAAGSGALSVRKEIMYAPKMKFEAVFDVTGALTAGHGVAFDVALMDDSDQSMKKNFAAADVITMPATMGAGETVTGKTLYISGEYPFVKKLYLTSVLDSSKATGLTQAVEGSLDGTNWYSVTISDTNITDADVNVAESSTFIGKYFRVNAVTAGGGSLTADHALSINVVALY
jgi:hypothetical protein